MRLTVPAWIMSVTVGVVRRILKTTDKIRNRAYWQGYAQGFNDVWDAVDEMILLRKPGKPLTWQQVRKNALHIERQEEESRKWQDRKGAKSR